MKIDIAVYIQYLLIIIAKTHDYEYLIVVILCAHVQLQLRSNDSRWVEELITIATVNVVLYARFLGIDLARFL